MKVKVRRIVAPYQDVPTESLQAVLRNYAHDRLQVRVSVDQLYAIMEELARRREASGQSFRSSEEAWADFVQHYMPRKDAENLQENLMVPHKLTPSLGGKECLGNGNWLGYECCCDECDHYLTCFPDWETMQQP